MKNGLPVNPVLYKMVVLITCFLLVMLYNKSKAHNPMQSFNNDFAKQQYAVLGNGF